MTFTLAATRTVTRNGESGSGGMRVSPMMDKTQADFFRENLLPIAREAAEDDATDPRHERNPLRPMLRQMLAYIEYLEGK